MPGWKFLEKLLHDEEPMHQACEEFFMKLKEQDKRPRRTFKVGDIVSYKPGKNSMSSPEGIVLKVELIDPPGGQRVGTTPIRQRCYCLFAPDGVTLRTQARQFAKKLFFEPDYKSSRLTTMENNRLEFIRECPKSWLQPISSMEIQTHRFSDLLEEEEDGPES